MATITITIPDTPEEQEEILSFLESKGLVNRKDILQPTETNPGQKSKWAIFAEKMHRESPLDGESEKFLKVTRQFRENFSFRP